jgi:general secretion pathway protein N
VRAGLSPFRLLIGEARINLRVVDATSAAPLQGALSQRIGGFGIVGMNGDVSMGQIFAPLPINGLAFTDLTVRFAGDMCMDAHGQVLARLNGGLDGVPGLAMPGSLSGVARCDAGMLVLPLISQAGTEVLIVHIKGDGRYRAELTIQVDDTALAQKLTMAGFVPEPKGYRLSVEGRF